MTHVALIALFTAKAVAGAVATLAACQIVRRAAPAAKPLAARRRR